MRFAERARLAVEREALAIIADKTSDPEDVAAATAALMRSTEDLGRLSMDELLLCEYIHRKAADSLGELKDRLPDVARSARVVADSLA